MKDNSTGKICESTWRWRQNKQTNKQEEGTGHRDKHSQKDADATKAQLGDNKLDTAICTLAPSWGTADAGVATAYLFA